MKIQSFYTVPAIRLHYADEGELYYQVADDQDPALLELAKRAELENDCELPEGIAVVWAGESVAVRQAASTSETEVSGAFVGMGLIVLARYLDETGQQCVMELTESEDAEHIERLVAALNALAEREGAPHIQLSVGVDATTDGAHVCLMTKGCDDDTHIIHSQFYAARQDGTQVVASIVAPIAQTTPQPAAWRWMYNGEPDGPYAFNHPLPDDDVVWRGLMAERPRTVQPLYAAPIAQAAPQDTVAVLEVWDAIGHDTGCNPGKDELLASLRNMAELATSEAAPQPEQSGLVEVLEKIKADTRRDDPLDHYDMVCRALASYRAALSAQGGE